MLKVISDSLLLTAGNRLSHAIYQQLFVFKTTENGACYQKNRGFIRRLDRIFEICQRKRTQKYIFCVLDWRPRGESNPRPHAQEQTRYDETKCNIVQENPWKYKVFHCFKSYLVSRFISIFIGILHRPIGSKLARLSIFGGRCKCKQIPLCNFS